MAAPRTSATEGLRYETGEFRRPRRQGLERPHGLQQLVRCQLEAGGCGGRGLLAARQGVVMLRHPACDDAPLSPPAAARPAFGWPIPILTDNRRRRYRPLTAFAAAKHLTTC